MRFVATLLLPTLLTIGCVNDDLEIGASDQAIVGGSPHSGDPAVVLLDLGGGLCTGTLVSPKVVLTAAHCLSGPAGNIRAMFVNQTGGTGDSITAATYENKPGTDIGAVALTSEGPVTPMPPNRMPLDSVVGQPVKIIGFGVTSETGSDSGQKRIGMSSLSGLSGEGIAAGEMLTTNTPQGTCYGDSGGPNIMTIDNVEVVVGVTSRGTDICGAGLDIAVRVDSHKDWLDSFMAANGDAADCGADGRCADGCATIDEDCCITDGACVEECGSLDPECGDGGGTGTTPGEMGANFEGACSTGGSPSNLLVVLLMAMLVSTRRRRRN